MTKISELQTCTTSDVRFDGNAGMKRRVIGGEFDIREPVFADSATHTDLTWGLDGTWFLSGRFALKRILRHLMNHGVHHVHLPAYLCDSVLKQVRLLGMEISFYPINDNLGAEADPPSGAAVVLIHYFGQINPAAAALRRQAPAEFYLIEDASQALLTNWRSCGAEQSYYFISPRKFGPVPLGGWCNILSETSECAAGNAISYRSLAARLIKGAYVTESDWPIVPKTEEFYLEAFKATEDFLSTESTSATLPDWVVSLIAGIDWRAAAAARLRNLEALIGALPDRIRSPLPPFASGEVPLGYPILCDNRDEMRRRLSERRMFCPVHWPLPPKVSPSEFPEAHLLSEQILTLPLDQRYGQEDMIRLAEAVSEFV